MLGLFRRRRSPLLRSKLDLIDLAMQRLGARTFADLGGVWGVEAGYTFYALSRGATAGVLVDTHPTATVLDKARAYPQLRVIHGNFGAEAVVAEVGQIDAVFLFDTLLHQVDPDWDRVLELYAARAKCLLIYNQQWVGPGRAVRLLDLGEEEYFRNVPHAPDEVPYAGLFAKLDTPHPDHGGRLWRNVHNIWQWGVTDADLLGKMQDLGFRFRFFVNDGQFAHLKNFENHAFVFSR
jgi:hypothetical protein